MFSNTGLRVFGRSIIGVTAALAFIVAPVRAQTDQKQAGPAQPQAARPQQAGHEGHSHGAAPQPAKPGQPPQPTVVLKPGESPAIEFDTPVYDFGRMKGAKVVRHDYYYTNNGTGPLELLTVRPACGCTTAGGYDRVVAPGETGKLPIELNTGKFVGPLSKTITIHTNCTGPNATVTLTIKGEVWQVIEVTPPSASFGKIEDKVALERRLTIQNNDTTPLQLTELSSSNPAFRAETREVEPGRRYELIVTAIPPLAPGANNSRITMKTNNADVPTLEVQAYAYVPQVVEVTPMQITIPGSTLATKRQVYVKHHDKTPLKITDLGCTNSAVTCTLNEQVQGQTFQIVVDVPAGYTPQPGGDRVTFKTDSPTMPTVTIPIMQMGVSATASRMPAMAGAARPQPAGAAPGAPAGSAAVGTGAPVKPAAEPTKPPASGTNP